MKIQHMVLLLVLVVVIFFGTVFMFVYKTFAPSSGDSQNQNPSAQNSQTNTIQNPNPAASTSPDILPPDVQAMINEPVEPLVYSSDCALQKKQAAQGREYKKGSVLVTFQDAMDFETAVRSMAFLNFETADTFESRKNFRQNHWLEITVPEGSEFYTQCQLEGSEGVKRTSLNFLFSLRQ